MRFPTAGEIAPCDDCAHWDYRKKWEVSCARFRQYTESGVIDISESGYLVIPLTKEKK